MIETAACFDIEFERIPISFHWQEPENLQICLFEEVIGVGF